MTIGARTRCDRVRSGPARLSVMNNQWQERRPRSGPETDLASRVRHRSSLAAVLAPFIVAYGLSLSNGAG